MNRTKKYLSWKAHKNLLIGVFWIVLEKIRGNKKLNSKSHSIIAIGTKIATPLLFFSFFAAAMMEVECAIDWFSNILYLAAQTVSSTKKIVENILKQYLKE